MTDLANKVVMITGAAGNLGVAVAAVCGAAGARTALVDRAQGRLEQLHPPSPQRLLLGGVDLTAEDQVGQAVAAALDRFGRIDALVATVGGFRGGKTVEEEELATWDLMMAMNLRTAVLACRAVLPAMRGQGQGAIVTVAAGAALNGPPGLAAYAASKAALLRFTESLAEEVGPAGIRVNAVLPGIIDTPQNRAAMPDADHGAWVAPAAIADAIAYLISDAARAVSGIALPVAAPSR